MALFTEDILAAANAAPAPVTKPVTGLGDDAWLDMSQALTTDAPVDVPGMVRPFLAHQAAAFLYMLAALARFGCVLLGHDMGLGKTQMMLAAVAKRLHEVGGYAVMVAPPVAKAGYIGDLQACFPHLRMHHLQGRKAGYRCSNCGDAMLWPTMAHPAPECAVEAGVCVPRLDVPQADIYFISDDPQTLQAWLTVPHEHTDRHGNTVTTMNASPFAKGCAMFTRDEIHRDKGIDGSPAKGVRTKVMDVLGHALREANVPRIGATGTLLTNKPIEGYLPLMFLGGESLITAVTPGATTPVGYKFRYCNPQKVHVGGGRFKTDFGGVDLSQMHNLHEYLRRTVYARIEKSDLGDVLPNSGWIVKPIALPDTAMRDYDRYAKDILAAIMDEGGVEAYLRASRAIKLVQIMKLWEKAGTAKAQAAADYVTDLVDQGRQVVTFHHHAATMQAMLKALAKAGITYTIIDGSVTGDARIQAITEFQNGDVQVVLAQLGAAGMAVTLTAAADAVFVQCPWSAGSLKQAADRILRVDDRTMERAKAGEAITWHVLQACYADGSTTFDANQWDVLTRKVAVVDAVNAGKPVTMSEDDLVVAALEEWVPSAQARYRL